MQGFFAPIEVSARHVHLTAEDFHTLFGSDVEISPARKISQPDQYVAAQRIEVSGPKSVFRDVAIVGPYRQATQIELAQTDARHIGSDATLAVSGSEVQNTVPLTLVGPAGSVEVKKDIIVAMRHLHCDAETAAKYGIKHLDRVKVRIKGDRAAVYEEVIVRSRDGKDALALHLDTDEGNATGVQPGDQCEIILEDIRAVPQPELLLD